MLRDFVGWETAEDAGSHGTVEEVVRAQITDFPRKLYSSSRLGRGAEPQRASTAVAAATGLRRSLNGVPRVLPRR